jgi:hypothetical protein
MQKKWHTYPSDLCQFNTLYKSRLIVNYLIKRFAYIAFLLCAPPVFSATSDYDGTWSGAISCTAYEGTNGQPFSRRNHYKIEGGRITASYFVRSQQSTNRLVWDGEVANGIVKLKALGSAEGVQPWTYAFSGAISSGEKMNMTGALYDAKGVKRRDCEMVFSLVEPAPRNTAARSTKTSAASATEITKYQAEADKARAEADKARAEADKARADAEKAKADAEKAKASVRTASQQSQKSSGTRVTPPPVPVPAGQSAAGPTPARAAAIGNVAGANTQKNSNEKFSKQRVSSNDVWVSFNPSITVQERQFCRIVENFRAENSAAKATNNQIKVNETYRNLVQSLNSLLPDGKFQGWIMRTVGVAQASDGSADVLLELPCNVYVGSNACDSNPKNFYGTAPEGSRIYSEFAKMTVGDFALVSGQFIYADEKVFDKGRSVTSFRYMPTAAHCRAKTVKSDTEFFGIKIDVVSTIK